MASFRAKIGWKSPRKSENKNYCSVPFRSYPMHNGKQQKNSKKIKNIKRKPLWRYFMPKQDGKGCEREKTKIFIPIRRLM